jgi:metal-sulfur cluster biosynthetic enzyme
MVDSDDRQAEDGPPDDEAVRDALRTVKDPEVGMNIVDLGLVYEIEVASQSVNVKMTLTSPGCPVGPQILGESEQATKRRHVRNC